VGSGAFGRGYWLGMPHLRSPRVADAPGAGQEDEDAIAEGGKRGGVRGGVRSVAFIRRVIIFYILITGV